MRAQRTIKFEVRHAPNIALQRTATRASATRVR